MPNGTQESNPGRWPAFFVAALIAAMTVSGPHDSGPLPVIGNSGL